MQPSVVAALLGSWGNENLGLRMQQLEGKKTKKKKTLHYAVCTHA